MLTLQDISIRLMKPAKDLADWKFPLSQILEEYYALLEEPCNINFGEAALVLQNSANVYVRRIECLLNETELLRQTFHGYDEEEMMKSSCKEKKSSKRSYINLENFNIIDLEKDIGKNINKKNQCQRKSIKLLSRRFTQLENNVVHLKIPLQVFDIYGEVIGKKYDFRVTQPVNLLGMLTDELTPHDFALSVCSRIQNGRNASSTSSEPKTGTGTSGYCSISPQKSITPIEFEEMERIDEENGSESFSEDRINETIVENNNKAVEHITSKEKIAAKVEENKKETETETVIENERLNGTKKSNQTKRMSVCGVNDICERDWKPMPLTCGIKQEMPNNFSPIKLPAYVSLSKRNIKSRKRKVTSGIRKTECITKFVLREREFSRENQGDSSIKPNIVPLRKQELEDFMKNFDDGFNVIDNDSKIISSHYEAVTGVAMDLLGFRVCGETNDSQTEDTIDEINSIRSPSPFNSTHLNSPSPTSLPYESLIEGRMRELLSSPSDLQHSVTAWHTSLQSRLMEAEHRPAFKIHEYGNWIMTTLKGMGEQSVGFEKVVHGMPPCEVARCFLASLQLANTYNVEIKKTDESTQNNIEISLLKLKKT